MKVKNMRKLFGLSLFAIAGAAAIAVGSKEAPAKADTPVFTPGSTLFFRSTTGWWYNDGAWTAAYFYNNNDPADPSDNEEYWAGTTYNYFTDNFCFVTVPEGNWPNVIFVRMKAGEDINKHWDARLNQTADLSAGEGDAYVYNEDSEQAGWHTFSDLQTWQIGSNGVLGSNLTYRNNSEGAVFYASGVALEKDATLYVHRDAGSGAEGWFKSQYFEEGVGSAVADGYITKNGDDNDATLAKAGSFDFFVKMNSQLIWNQVNSQAVAEAYASSFLTNVTCNGTDKTFADSVWTDMKNAFDAMSTGAKNIFKDAEPGSANNITKTVERYDHIIMRYGTAKYADFMNRFGGEYNPAALPEFDASTSTNAIIIIAAVTSVLTLSIVLVIRVKAKKQK